MGSLASINIRFVADLAQFSTQIQNANRKIKKMGRDMTRTGQKLTVGLTAPLTGIGLVASNAFSSLEQEMAKVRAISGATKTDFLALKKSALDLGAATQYTSSQVAGLQLNYSKLGFSPDEIVKVTAATLDLATATGEDLGESALVAASTLRGFGLEVSQMPRLVDVMAKSFSSSALNLEKFQVAMATLAPVAKNANVSLEEATSYLSILVDRGVDATTAGTGLRNIFLDLAGNGRSLESAMTKIAQATNKNKVAFDLFGKRGATVASIMASNTLEAKKLEQSFINSGGAAKKMSEIMSDTQEGSILKMKSAIEAVSISLGEQLSPYIKSAAEQISKLAQSFNNLTPETKKFIVVLSGIAAASGPLLVIAGTVLPAISAGFVALTGPIGLAVAALAGVAVVIAKNWEPIKKLLVSIANYFVDLYNESTAFRISVEAIALSFKNMFAAVKTIFENIYKIITAVIKQLALQFESFGTVIKGALTLDTTLIKKAVTDLVSSTKNNFSDTISSIGQNFNSTFNEVSENLKTALDNSLKKIKYVLPVTLEVKNTVNKASAVSSSAASPQRARVSSAITAITPVGLQPLVMNLKEPEADLKATLTRMGQNFTEFSVLASQAIEDAATNVITGFGEMIGGLITGEASIQDFASSFIGILGDLAIQLGKIAIQIGVAMLAIRDSFKVPGKAIAAGIALIALGKIIKSASSVFSSRDAGGFTQGGVVGGSSFFGDRLFARVNSGELILNQGQQRNLNNMLDHQSSKNLNLNLVVEGEITGQNLALALKRYTITEGRSK